MDAWQGKHVWIIGAGSGIGRALALELSRRGARLSLSGRNAERLDAVNQEAGGAHFIAPFDAADPAATVTAFAAVRQQGEIDALIFLAGQYQPMRLDTLDLAACRDIVITNLLGPLNTIGTVLPTFLQRKAGQIALCASVAGYRGLPAGQPYGATKAGLINLTESLRAETRGTGVDVRLIDPGFVRTPMTDKNSFHMPMMIEPEEAALAIANGLLSHAFEIHFPRRFTWMMKVLQCLPYWLYFKLAPR
jgi:short-subunit dehydrogenase